jgi:hypothetical protein
MREKNVAAVENFLLLHICALNAQKCNNRKFSTSAAFFLSLNSAPISIGQRSDFHLWGGYFPKLRCVKKKL